MHGYVAVTDPGWYELLSRTPGPKDANFWRPSARPFARLDVGTPLRIWTECQGRSTARATGEVLTVSEPVARYGTPTLATPRLGQGIFPVRVLDAYDRACSVTGEHSLPVLEAAHIKPYANGGEHAVSNGLSLRSDLHRLFDRGYVTMDGEQRFVVGRRLKDEFENGKSYCGLHGQTLALPPEAGMKPSAAALAWHRGTVFLG